jgi:hypothetical protein
VFRTAHVLLVSPKTQRFWASNKNIILLPYLVGGFNHLEKYAHQWEGLSHILWKKCLKPPTRREWIKTYASNHLFGMNILEISNT